MDSCQITLPAQSVREFDWTDIHYARRNGASESRFQTSISPCSSLSAAQLSHSLVLCCLPADLHIIRSLLGESVRREYPHLTNDLIRNQALPHSIRRNACLCNYEVQAQCCKVGECIVYFLCYRCTGAINVLVATAR